MKNWDAKTPKKRRGVTDGVVRRRQRRLRERTVERQSSSGVASGHLARPPATPTCCRSAFGKHNARPASINIRPAEALFNPIRRTDS